MEDHVRIFDTTLRDGEQAPGCTMTLEEKLEVARQLARLGVDIIEAGFPAASPGDWAAVHEIARTVGTPDGPIIAALARANKDDIDKAWSAVQPAAKKRIHTFISSSDIHIEHQLRSTREEVLERARMMVRYARSLCDDVEFSPMDATRSDPEYVYRMLAAVVEEGATTLNIPDTVGYATPEEYAELIAGIYRHVPGAEKVIISTHCHDDLGMAVANSLAGVRAGARQIECTINGIGERAGNASLEEVVMALKTRRSFFGVDTRINTRELARSSRLVSRIIGMPVPPNKAIVGANAFAHESGIHQDGVLKCRMTYEIMDATMIGLEGNAIVLGKHSGRNALRTKLAAMGYEFDNEEEFNQVFQRFKELCDKKKVIDDRDLEVLATGGSLHTPELYRLDHVQVTCGTGVTPVATVRITDPDGNTHTTAAHGTGPVDAIYKAIDKIVGRPNELIEFSIKAVTEGIDAVAEVSVRIREPGNEVQDGEYRVGRHRGPQIYSGYSANTDTIVAAAESYMAALNKMIAARQERLSAENAAYAAGYDRNKPTYAVDLFGKNATE
ncbi:MAG: 2-isopropylmalate synthase [Roseiflexus sp.]|jgi:2-isopropylmalate synthase, bacterial type|nr:2-isopropylmalate synthase [Roseiflexus sp.]MBO9334593.1 2-isopropylmalate synthase [Roseiflexus sp.]MBO9364965.1 2-isopropylmalate synthase [Roseiflexus sp.]MBO9382640.1 2-isopropylmalate synthase [Roseiflexus sp.]MBO9387608.1 2-isopropylmalate synthase [Roseiflexus sp.]